MKTLAIWLVVAGTLPAGEILTGKVVSVSDGDTVRVYITGDRTTTKVRLDGIDAPEKGQPFGTTSKNYLTKLAKGKSCTVRHMGTDKYGRMLGIVTIRGQPLNRQSSVTADYSAASLPAI